MNEITNSLISSTIRDQNKYELQVQEFLKTLLENEGFYAMPRVLYKIKGSMSEDTYELERKEIYDQTREILKMMDIEYKVLPNKHAIMIVQGGSNGTPNTTS